MFHQDELVHNFLTQALQRYAELRLEQLRQSDELDRRRLSSNAAGGPSLSAAGAAAGAMDSAPAFERKNTLLLTGKSKFYTMSYEDHCQSATDRVPAQSAKKQRKAGDENHTGTNRSCSALSTHEQCSNEVSCRLPTADSNHNSIFWNKCCDTDSCQSHSGAVLWTGTETGCRATMCLMPYPTAATKL